MSIEVKSVFAVDAPHLTSPWLPKTKTVDGVTYCRLHKWDRGLIRFAKGEALDFRNSSGQSFNIALLDDLCRLRNVACDSEFKRIGDQGAAEDGAKKPKKYTRKARKTDEQILPSSVVVTLPTVALPDGAVVDGFDVRALVEGIRTSEIYLEMTTETLTNIWEVVQKSQTRGRHWRKQESGTRSTRSKAGNKKRSHSRSRSRLSDADRDVEAFVREV
jgi:hypothetical protein